VVLASSDARLLEGFNWAKMQAMEYVHTGDPVGEWYVGGDPPRNAFCPRDISHQSIGAQVLGLQQYTKNMLYKLAKSISDSKDWAVYWEINRNDVPAPEDYRSDKDFWFNLPANFDILQTCYRQYLWTGDRAYLEDPTFLNFYEETVNDYVKRWDKDGDGLMESRRAYRWRGIGSYDENLSLQPLMGSDLVAAQYAGYLAYSKIMALKGNTKAAKEYRHKALIVKSLFNSDWWSNALQRHYTAMLQDKTFYGGYTDTFYYMLFWFGNIPEEGPKTNQTLEYLISHGAHNVEGMSYLPLIYYQYGRNDAAYAALCQLIDPALKRRDYPEVSYSVVGTVATGLMGISADASRRLVQTFPRLTRETNWVSIDQLPVFGNEISVRHTGDNETTLTNQSGGPLQWKAAFKAPGDLPNLTSGELLVNDSPIEAHRGFQINEQRDIYVVLTVQPGQTYTVRLPMQHVKAGSE